KPVSIRSLFLLISINREAGADTNSLTDPTNRILKKSARWKMIRASWLCERRSAFSRRSLVPLIVGPRLRSSKLLRETYGERFLPDRKHVRFANHFLSRHSSVRLKFRKRRVNRIQICSTYLFFLVMLRKRKTKSRRGTN